VLGAAGIGVVHGRISPGELLAAVGYVGLALGLLRQSAGLARAARAYGSACRVAEVVAGAVHRPGRATLPAGPGELRFQGVHTERNGKTALRNVDLVVPARATIAVVGASGSGKSAFLETAGGLRRPDAGSVSLDGIPLDEIDPGELRSAVAYAFERPVLLGHTVADAIGYGHHAVAPDELRQALRVVRAEAFVDRLPDGADTSMQAVRLSGGEVQRLGLARAACRNARLLLLDDATSSLDTATEAEIGASLAELARETTCLLITRRATIAARSDLVLWLTAGRIEALAPHAELWHDPHYRRLFGPTSSGVPDVRAEAAR
jgi:ATP-binding cassette subfamily B protein